MVMQLVEKSRVVDLIKQEISELAAYLPRIAQERPDQYVRCLQGKLAYIDAMLRCCPGDRKQLVQFCVEACAPELRRSQVQRQCVDKPLGYAGDFQIIEWIYERKCDSQGRGKLWDMLFHDQAAAQAVCKRKDYFCDLFSSICKQTPAPRSVLNIASGPCREITDAVKRAGACAKGTHFHCVDIEDKAIAHGREVVRNLEGVSFQWETTNALRLRPTRQYELVWSAGLFDYLNDRLATRLLKRMWAWTKPGGTCVAGNFHVDNPSRNYMEWCGDWCLIHRTDDEMQRLCGDAGIPMNCVEITHDSLGTIVYVVASK